MAQALLVRCSGHHWTWSGPGKDIKQPVVSCQGISSSPSLHAGSWLDPATSTPLSHATIYYWHNENNKSDFPHYNSLYIISTSYTLLVSGKDTMALLFCMQLFRFVESSLLTRTRHQTLLSVKQCSFICDLTWDLGHMSVDSKSANLTNHLMVTYIR